MVSSQRMRSPVCRITQYMSEHIIPNKQLMELCKQNSNVRYAEDPVKSLQNQYDRLIFVKKNPLNRIFLTEYVGKNGVFLLSITV
jgi:hypothetical protein